MNSSGKGYTSKEAAELVGISVGRIQQLAKSNEIEHEYFGRNLLITPLGIEQARARNKQPGRPPRRNIQLFTAGRRSAA